MNGKRFSPFGFVLGRYVLICMVYVAAAYISPFLLMGLMLGLIIKSVYSYRLALRLAEQRMAHAELRSGIILWCISIITGILVLVALLSGGM